MEFDGNTCNNIIRATVAELGLDPASGNFMPAEASVAIDAGDNALLENLLCDGETDCVGTQRIYNRTVDLGAFEYGMSSSSTTSLFRKVVRNSRDLKSRSVKAFDLQGRFLGKVLVEYGADFVPNKNVYLKY
jgi:hypothetical protein